MDQLEQALHFIRDWRLEEARIYLEEMLKQEMDIGVDLVKEYEMAKKLAMEIMGGCRFSP